METDKQTQLRIENITLSFGGVHALSDVSVDIRNNEILAIIGPNGAGKTALLNCINGFYKPEKGEIYYRGEKLSRMRPDKLAKLGIARTFQNIELYTGLSTQDNIMASRHVLMRQNFLTGALYFGWAQKEEIAHRQIVEEIIDFLEIAPIRKKHVGLLPYGLRKRVELARALALEPKVLLLDEPMAGMNLEEKKILPDSSSMCSKARGPRILIHRFSGMESSALYLWNTTWVWLWTLLIGLLFWTLGVRLLKARRRKSARIPRLLARTLERGSSALESWSEGSMEFTDKLKREPQNIECRISNVEGMADQRRPLTSLNRLRDSIFFVRHSSFG